MKLFDKLFRAGFPKYKRNVWYNRAAHLSAEKYPEMFDENNKYIPCEIGLEVKMGETSGGKSVYYKVIDMGRSRGSDWLYDSDAINCDLKFSKIK